MTPQLDPATRPPHAGDDHDGLVGQEWILDVGSIAHGGHCVARHEGRAVFVRHSLPGETVRARVTRSGPRGRYAFADAVEVLTPSPDRVTAPCPYAGPGRCGGCDFQHVAPEAQRRLKSAVITEQLERLAHISPDVSVEALPGDEAGLRWRTRMSFAVDRQGAAGLLRFHSRQVVPLDDCLIASRAVVATGVLNRRHPGMQRIDVVSPSQGPAVVLEVPRRRPAHRPSRPAKVNETVRVGESGHTFQLDPRAFWQVHPDAPTALTAAVIEGLEPRSGDRVVDLYAGVGLFGRFLADAVGRNGSVTLVEDDPRACAAAARWAVGLPHVQVLSDRAVRALQTMVAGGETVDGVVLDPPRAGAGKEVVEGLTRLGPGRIVYVACDPAALARDTALLATAGHRLERLVSFDLFPMTHHVECVATFRAGGSRAGVRA